jgi:hypothetical protein
VQAAKRGSGVAFFNSFGSSGLAAWEDQKRNFKLQTSNFKLQAGVME